MNSLDSMEGIDPSAHRRALRIERTLNQMHDAHDSALLDLPLLPDKLVADSFLYKEVRKVMKNRGVLSRVSGFFLGYVIGLDAAKL